MKQGRIFLVITGVAAALIFLLSLDLPGAQPPPVPTPPPAQAGQAPAPTATAVPPGWAAPFVRVQENTAALDRYILRPLWSVLRVLGLAAAGVLGIYLAAVILSLVFSRPALVFEDLTNPTGSPDLDASLNGLTFQARRALAADLRELKERNRQYGRQMLGTSLREDRIADEIAHLSDQRLDRLIQSVSEYTPAEIKPALGLVRGLFPERVTSVSASLVLRAGRPRRPAIALQIADARHRYPPIQEWIEDPDAAAREADPPGDTPGSAPPAPGLNLPEAVYLRRAGERLLAAGQTGGALELLQAALEQQPGDPATARALAAGLARQQLENSSLAAYQLGDRLRAAGLLDQAAELYADALPAQRRRAALHAWRAALALSPDGLPRGEAWFRLAGYYREVFLDQQAAALYGLAAGEGYPLALPALKTWREQQVQALVEAAEILAELGRFATARGYLTAALDLLPQDPRARDALARLTALDPHGGLGPAGKAYQLAAFYRAVGRLDQAQKHAEEALAAQPTNARTQALVRAVVDEQDALPARFEELVHQAARCTAIELMCQELLLKPPFQVRLTHGLRRAAAGLGVEEKLLEWEWFALNVPSAADYRSRVHNYAALLYRASLRGSPNWLYYEKAVRHFEQAKALRPRAWEPVKYLADLQILAYRRRPVPPETREELFDQASKGYDLAAALVQPSQWREKFQIHLARAMMLLRTKIPEHFGKSCEEIQKIVAPAAPPPPCGQATGRRSWWKTPPRADPRDPQPIEKLAFHMTPDFVYNLACWYNLAYERMAGATTPDDQQRRAEYYCAARQLLPRYLLRDEKRDYWVNADTDDDLKSVRKDLPVLKQAIETGGKKFQKLSALRRPEEFEQKVQMLIKESNWALDPPQGGMP